MEDDRMEDASRYENEDSSSSSGDGAEDDDEEEAKLLQEKAYKQHLPIVKELLGNERPNLLKDEAERQCRVCRSCKYYKGWKALMAHAKSFKKKKPDQHKGLYRALLEVITPNAEPGITRVELSTTRVSSSIAMHENRQRVWPPVLLLEASESIQAAQKLAYEVLGPEVLDHIVCVRSKLLLVLKDHSTSLTAVHHLECKKKGPFLVLEPQDMLDVDPEQKVQWSSSTQDQVIQRFKARNRDAETSNNQFRASKLKDAMMDQEKDRVREVQLQLGRSVEESKRQSERLSQESRQMEDANAKTVQEEARNFDYEMRRMQNQWQQAESGMQRALDYGAKKGVHEKVRMLEYNKHLQKVINEGSERTKKYSRNCLELQSYKQTLDDKLRADHFGLEDSYRSDVRELIAVQQKELKKMEEEFEEHVISDLLAAPQIATQQEPVQKCSVCWMEFGSEVDMRGLLKCGHAGFCIDCALSMFKSKSRCPICRATIDRKPVATFYRIYT